VTDAKTEPTTETITTTIQGSIQNDTHTDYHSAKEAALAAMERGVWQDRFDKRFVPMERREMRCDLPRTAIEALANGKNYASYRGLPMAKDPLDRVLYETLFYEIQPKTVIELGAYTGASAMWMADVLKTFDIDGRVIAVDVDLELIEDAVRENGGVTLIEGDLNDITKVFPKEMLAELPTLSSADYLVIEDTVPWIPSAFGTEEEDSESVDEAVEWGEWKWEEVREFFEQCDSEYLVDRYYTDFFGYNGTWNWNGFLRKK